MSQPRDYKLFNITRCLGHKSGKDCLQSQTVTPQDGVTAFTAHLGTYDFDFDTTKPLKGP
ncbi:hypothetical protein HDV00_009708, partial [Rhizophlyctis rosea]